MVKLFFYPVKGQKFVFFSFSSFLMDINKHSFPPGAGLKINCNKCFAHFRETVKIFWGSAPSKKEKLKCEILNIKWRRCSKVDSALSRTVLCLVLWLALRCPGQCSAQCFGWLCAVPDSALLSALVGSALSRTVLCSVLWLALRCPRLCYARI